MSDDAVPHDNLDGYELVGTALRNEAARQALFHPSPLVWDSEGRAYHDEEMKKHRALHPLCATCAGQN